MPVDEAQTEDITTPTQPAQATEELLLQDNQPQDDQPQGDQPQEEWPQDEQPGHLGLLVSLNGLPGIVPAADVDDEVKSCIPAIN
jgi:hypothetical protein